MRREMDDPELPKLRAFDRVNREVDQHGDGVSLVFNAALQGSQSWPPPRLCWSKNVRTPCRLSQSFSAAACSASRRL